MHMPIKPIAKALREARSSILTIALFHSALDTIVAFSLLALACLILGISYWWAFGISFIYAIIHTYGQIRTVTYKVIESKVPDLQEKLRTAADYTEEDNEILRDLNQEVLQQMRNVRTGDFINFAKVTRELLVVTVVSFLIIGASAFNVQFLDVKGIIKEVQDFKPFQEYEINEDLLAYEESQNLSEILGDESLEALGQQQLDLQLNPLKTDVDIGTVNPPESRSFREVPPPQIRATSDQSYEENIPKQYQRIVKTYFKEITTT